MSKQGQSDSAQLSALGYESNYHRSLTVWSTLALGFTYLSPLVAIYALFGLGLATAGPGAIFWILLVGGGQLLVAFVMGEVVSQFPIAGGIYPWMRRLAGKRSAWLTAWVYVWAMLVTITSVAEYGVGFLATVIGVDGTVPEIQLALAVALLVLALLLNLGGTKTLARIAKIGLAAELVGVVGLGLYLLIFERQNDFSIFWADFGAPEYGSAFLAAALVGLFMFYGFEACGDVAEEVSDAAREVPKAMYLTILVGGVSALMSFGGYVLAASPSSSQRSPPVKTLTRSGQSWPTSSVRPGHASSWSSRSWRSSRASCHCRRPPVVCCTRSHATKCSPPASGSLKSATARRFRPTRCSSRASFRSCLRWSFTFARTLSSRSRHSRFSASTWRSSRLS